MDKLQNTEDLIKEAARKVFTSKGLSASRMEDIAAEAGVTKALVNYYYRSKERLFEAIFQEEMLELTENTRRILENNQMSILDKIRGIIYGDFDVFLKNPGLPLFVMSEMARNPCLVDDCKAHLPKSNLLDDFVQQINKEVALGNLKAVDARMLWIDMLSLITMPFVAKSFVAHLLHLNDEAYLQLMHTRKTHVAEFIINSIAIQPTVSATQAA